MSVKKGITLSDVTTERDHDRVVNTLSPPGYWPSFSEKGVLVFKIESDKGELLGAFFMLTTSTGHSIVDGLTLKSSASVFTRGRCLRAYLDFLRALDKSGSKFAGLVGSENEPLLKLYTKAGMKVSHEAYRLVY